MRKDWTVLIIEDSALIAANTEQVARDMGAAKVTLMRAPQALERVLLRGLTPDIAVIDHRSVNHGAAELLDLVIGTGAMLIITTTDSDRGSQWLLQTAHAVLRKPFSEDELRAALQSALDAAD